MLETTTQREDGIFLQQVHGNDLFDHRLYPYGDIVAADGHIFDKDDDRHFIIVTADCLPIFLIGERGCALVHAGHRGLRQRILLSSKLADILPKRAFIGPSICAKCYMVSAGFDEGMFTQSIKWGDNYFFSLQREAIAQLATMHVVTTDLALCTYQSSFYSYRRGDRDLRNFTIFKGKI